MSGQIGGNGGNVLVENVIVQQSSLNPANKIEIYPNPAVDFLIIHIQKSELIDAEFEMHSLIGNSIKIEPEEIGLDTYRINVKEFSTGYYFLVVKDEVTRYKKAFKFLKR
jgi:hypothetical protein